MKAEKVVITDCIQYYVSVPGQSWGTFTFSPLGDFFIHSDWGYWAFNWRHFGDDFKKFLIGIDEHYLLTKIESNQIQFYGIKKKISPRIKEAITSLFHAFQEELKHSLTSKELTIKE